MRIKLSELRQIVQEAFTQHQLDIVKSMLTNAQQNAGDYVIFLKNGEGDKNDVLAGLAASTKETRGWAPVFGRNYPEKAAVAKRIAEVCAELDKMAVKPFGGLLGKGKFASQAKALYDELTQLCTDGLDIAQYSGDYKAVRGDMFSVKSGDSHRIKV